jgi:tetratricopeptide (TPR) repeat protein
VQLVGPNGALYENMAHTYNSTGDYENAEKYFNLAMELVKDKSKKGGILLGIGLVKERKGDPRKALPHLKKALKLYQVASPKLLSTLWAWDGIAAGLSELELRTLDPEP